MVNVRKEIGVDWLSVTGGGEFVDRVADLLEQWSPRAEWKELGPGQGYGRRFLLPIGVRLSVDRAKSGRFWLDVNGGGCATLGAERVHVLAQNAGMGGTFTRVDVRMDLRGEGVTLLDDVASSAMAGEMRGLHRFQRWPIYDADTRLVGDGVSLGSYGSPRLIRVYDKGLQTGEAPKGSWVRWEAQLRDEYAHKAGCDIFSADLADLPHTSLPHAFDAVDFRVGPRDVKASRLDRPVWWQSLLDGLGDADSARDPRNVDLERWAEAVREQYGRVVVAISERASVPVGDVAEWLLSGLKPNAGTWKNPVVNLASDAFLDSRLRSRS